MVGAVRSLLPVRVLVWGPIVALTVLWFGWAASGGLGHVYYTGSARTLAGNPGWLISGALDSGGFVTVDKPPLGLWGTALGVAVGGTRPFALILPSALFAWGVAWLAARTAPRKWDCCSLR